MAYRDAPFVTSIIKWVSDRVDQMEAEKEVWEVQDTSAPGSAGFNGFQGHIVRNKVL